jgi:TfoX/Sxy family transcriptional regulator of competence genes
LEGLVASPTWEKVPQALADTFAAEVALRPDLVPRTMFGYPAAFVGGNLTTGLYGSGWMLRLHETDRALLLAAGGRPFEPMPGRPMKEYVLLPASVIEDPGARAAWIDRAIGFVRTLPPKA